MQDELRRAVPAAGIPIRHNAVFFGRLIPSCPFMRHGWCRRTHRLADAFDTLSQIRIHCQCSRWVSSCGFVQGDVACDKVWSPYAKRKTALAVSVFRPTGGLFGDQKNCFVFCFVVRQCPFGGPTWGGGAALLPVWRELGSGGLHLTVIRKTTEGLTECWREGNEGSWGLRVFGSRDDLSVLLAPVAR